MKIPLQEKIAGFIEGLIEHSKGFILAVIAVVAVLGLLTGYRYYRYTEDDPHYCASCHLMQEAYKEWERGKHGEVLCQQCHSLTMLEQNKLLMAYVLQGNKPLSQTHGREKPWAACKKCHAGEMAQGSLTIKKSRGHDLHIAVKNIGCKTCHESSLHNFKPNEKACQECHKDKGVHGIGMEAFSCLKCHSFSEKTQAMIPKDRCIKCHTKIQSTGPMSGLMCRQCHKPHKKIIPKETDCISNCHHNEATTGKHGLHAKLSLHCLDCHKPHSWTVTESKAKRLCSKCHAYKAPATFVY
ncbi:MAG: hypothetical protein EPN22_05750 [Nitrospirae bacterium]|nr:MAG: hypothetical protein EPN22_05750 [Nitrospirota bacterium]